MSIKTLLEEEIVNELDSLSKIELGTESYNNTVNGVTKLMDKKLEIEKLEVERDIQIKSQLREHSLKVEQMAEERKDRKVHYVLTGLGLAIPACITIWGTITSLEFEKEGTITTPIGRGFINKLLPKK